MKLLTAALLATILASTAMAFEAQVYRPDGNTETFKGVKDVVPGASPNVYSLYDKNGDTIAVIINMPMIVRSEDKGDDR